MADRSPLRLLFLNHNVAESGGTFWRAFHLGHALAERGHDVTLVTISPSARGRFRVRRRLGVWVVESPDLLRGRGRTGWDPWDALRRTVWCLGGCWDLVHAFDCRPAVILPALAVKASGVPLVIDWADWWGRGGTARERGTGVVIRLLEPLETFFEERFRHLADGTTVISRPLHDRALGLGVDPTRILILPQGSDVTGVTPGDRFAARTTLALDPSTRYLGHVGSLFPRDARLLVRTFDALCRSDPSVGLILVGRHGLQAADFAHPGRVRDAGYASTEDLRLLVDACDAMILPLTDVLANRARWPSKINDYMAAGRPTVATRVGDVADVVEQHRIGAVADPDPNALASASAALLEDRAALAEAGHRARHLAETTFSWGRIAEKVERFYASVRDGSRTTFKAR